MSKKPNIISFRLAPEHHALLSGQVAPGGSLGQHARDLVIRSLHQDLLGRQLEERLQSLAEGQERLRKELRVVLQALVRLEGKVPKDQLQQYLDAVLR